MIGLKHGIMNFSLTLNGKTVEPPRYKPDVMGISVVIF